jgi:hypothetical protein
VPTLVSSWIRPCLGSFEEEALWCVRGGIGSVTVYVILMFFFFKIISVPHTEIGPESSFVHFRPLLTFNV